MEKKYRNFILGGSALDEVNKKRFREISEELSTLSLKFDENILEETNNYELHITNKEDLSGLPEGLIELASSEAKERGKSGWIFTLNYPSYIPFMQYSEKRELREQMFKAYSSRSYRDNEFDNKKIVYKITNLRLELSKVLGFRNYAGVVLGNRMANTQEKVEKFLDELFTAARPAAERDFLRLQRYASELGLDGALEKVGLGVLF